MFCFPGPFSDYPYFHFQKHFCIEFVDVQKERPRVNILNVHNIMYNVYIHVNNSCGISKQIVLTSTKMKQNKKQTYKKKPF